MDKKKKIKSLTIEDIKKRKMELELKVLNMFKDFEKDTGLVVTYIDTIRKHEKNTNSMKVAESKPEAKRTLKDVIINIDLDLIYG